MFKKKTHRPIEKSSKADQHLRLLSSAFFVVMLSGFTLLHGQSNFSSKLIGVGVVVEDINRSLDFYLNVIGMKKTGTIDLKGDFTKRSGLADSTSLFIHVLKLEDSPESNEWKLMSSDKKETVAPKKFVTDSKGMQYITIHVKSLQPVMERMMERHIPFLGQTPTKLDDKRHFVLLQDPDGNFIELIGPLAQ